MSLFESSLGRFLQESAGARELGSFIMLCDRAGSTNDLARRLAQWGAPHGSLVLVEEQTAGRGRWQRSWASPPGGLYLSALLRPPPEKVVPVRLLPITASVAAAESVIDSSELPCRIRWPNDLVLAGRKLGGILCEGSFVGDKPEFVIAGFGINVNQTQDDFPQDLQDSATSLLIESGRLFDIQQLAARLAERLELWWDESLTDSRRLFGRWRELVSGQDGSEVEVRMRDGGSLRAFTAGLTDEGGLRVRGEGGSDRVLRAEEVLHIRFL